MTPCVGIVVGFAAIAVLSAAARAQDFPIEHVPGKGPLEMAAGDVNRDGRQDVIAANYSLYSVEGYVLLYLGNAAGSYEPPQVIAQLDDLYEVAAGDLDGDGDADAVAVHEVADPASALAVLLSDGVGGFAPQPEIPAGLEATSVALADLDHDGDLDAVITNGTTPGQLTVLLGDGSGSFALHGAFPCGHGPVDVALADLDANGTIDAVSADLGSGTVSALKGDGAGGFGAASVYVTPTPPNAIAVGDVSGDGRLDLVVSRLFFAVGGVSVLAGDGTGGFVLGVDWLTGKPMTGLAVGDLDGDGLRDVTATVGDGHVDVLLADGVGGVKQARSYLAAHWSLHDVLALDPDGDGALDLVAGGDLGLSVVSPLGHGQYAESASLAANVSKASVALADLDGSGRLDVLVAGDPAGAGGALRVFLADASGAYGAPASYGGSAPAQSLITAELGGDGRADAVTLDAASGSLSVYAGDGAGGLLAPIAYAAGAGAADVAAGDLDADGRTDLVTANLGADSISILRGVGAGAFSAAVELPIGPKTHAVGLADLDGNGTLDLVAAFDKASDLHDVAVLLGTGGGGFAAPSLQIGSTIETVALADIDLDGDVDLAGARGGNARVWLGDGHGAFAIPKDHALPYPAYVPVAALRIGDLDADGLPDLSTANTLGVATALYGTGGGDYGKRRSYLSAMLSSDVAVGDLDGDGRNELAIASIAGEVALLRNLGPAPSGITGYGTGSPGCAGTIGMTASVAPRVGAADFALVCSNAPALGAGLAALARAADVAGSTPLPGLLVHVDALVAFLPIHCDASGAGQVPLPIPASPGLAGATAYAQTFFAAKPDVACGSSPLHLVSSVGLRIDVQP